MSVLDNINQSLQNGKQEEVVEGVNKALDEGISAEKILNQALLKGMGVVSEKFKNNDLFVPEVLVAANAMNKGMEIIKPQLVEEGVESSAKAIIGTVEGDLHDIGKNLVRMMLEGEGFEVTDLGKDVSAEDFINAVKEEDPQIIGMSAMLTTTMDGMKEVVDALEENDLREDVYIMVGGAPVTDDYAQEIGADAYSADAGEAASMATAQV